MLLRSCAETASAFFLPNTTNASPGLTSLFKSNFLSSNISFVSLLCSIISYLSLKDGDNDKKQIIIDELAELSLNKKYVLPPYSEEIINELISTINIEREKARTVQAFKEGSKGKSQSEQALQAQNYLNKKRAMIEHLENKK